MLHVFQGNRRDGLHRVKHTKGASIVPFAINTTTKVILPAYNPLGDLGCSSCG